MRRMCANTVLVLAAACAATLLAASSATAATSIGPGQYFVGEVNSATQKAVLTVLCVGPSANGHPLGDTVSVVQTTPAASRAGATGKATQIRVDLSVTAPTPAAHPIHLTTFTTYGDQKLDPALVLPCATAGVVTFTPVAGGSAARVFAAAVIIRNPGV